MVWYLQRETTSIVPSPVLSDQSLVLQLICFSSYARLQERMNYINIFLTCFFSFLHARACIVT